MEQICQLGTKGKPKTEVFRKAKCHEITVHVAPLMDLSHLKNAEFATHLQKYKERVVLREDDVTDKEGYRATFAKQGKTDGSGEVPRRSPTTSWHVFSSMWCSCTEEMQ